MSRNVKLFPHGLSAGARSPERQHRPAGLYIHTPFCSALCPYCDFAVTVGSADRRQRFVKTLIREIELVGRELRPRFGSFDTIYFGGGTPSQLEPTQLEVILDAVGEGFDLGVDRARIFLEVNPEDVTASSLHSWLQAGVTTLSLGVQSFDNSELAFLGRHHRRDAAIESVRAALGAGFSTISIDLIYALPGQDTGALRSSLEQAIELAPDHLSCYSLEIHPRTRFGVLAARGELGSVGDHRARPRARPQRESNVEHFFTTHRTLSAAGYEPYEVSSFAREPTHRSRHNSKYWNHTPYLGLGPSAHSFDGRQRWWNERSTAAYSSSVQGGRLPIADTEILSIDDLALETAMMSLRTAAGLDLADFEARFGTDPRTRNRERAEHWIEAGLLEARGDRWVPTLEGLAVADRLAAELEL